MCKIPPGESAASFLPSSLLRPPSSPFPTPMFNMNVSISSVRSLRCTTARARPFFLIPLPRCLQSRSPRQAAHVERYISYKFMYMRAAPPPLLC